MAAVGATSSSRRRTRPRGERTRQNILDATLRVIAREGVRRTTHRAIAREAGVQLSLTTYHFRDLKQLIYLAFSRFSERDHAELAVEFGRAFVYLDQFSSGELKDPKSKQRIIDYCTKRVVDHIRQSLTHSRDNLAVEHHFLYESLNDPDLQALARQHHGDLLAPLVRFCAYFNDVDPETDASLLLGTITRLEYQSLPVEPDYRAIRREIRRIMAWIVNAA